MGDYWFLQKFCRLKQGHLKALPRKQILHHCTQLLIWALGVLIRQGYLILRHEFNYFLWFLKQYATLFLKNIRNKRHRKRDFLFMSKVSYTWRSVNDYSVVHLILSLLDLKFCIDEAIYNLSHYIFALFLKVSLQSK